MPALAPFVVISVQSPVDLTVSDLESLLKSWADDQGADCTDDWQTVAEQLLLTGPGEPVGWKPDFAWRGSHRWAACVREAGTEHHVYAGLVPNSEGARLPKEVALKATSLLDRISAARLRVGTRRRVRLDPQAELLVRGNASGRTLRPRTGWWRIARDKKTLQDAVPLFIVALASWVRQATQDDGRMPWAFAYDAALVAFILVVAFGILVMIKRLSVQADERWEATEWPR